MSSRLASFSGMTAPAKKSATSEPGLPYVIASHPKCYHYWLDDLLPHFMSGYGALAN